MAEALIAQVVVGGSFQVAATTTLPFLRLKVQAQAGSMPFGWGVRLYYRSPGQAYFLGGDFVPLFGGALGTSIAESTLVRMPVTAGLQRAIIITTPRQVGIPLDIFAGNETDYF